MKNIKIKIIVSLAIIASLASTANATMVPGVALVVTPASQSETVGSTFYTSVVVKTPGEKVYAVEGTIVLDGLSCQSIMIADGLMAQSVPTCEKPYFLIGVPSGTASDKAVLRVTVKALRPGQVTMNILAVDVIGAGLSLSSETIGAVYSITENIKIVPPVKHPKPQAITEEATTSVAISKMSTQLAAVANFVSTNSMMFWTIILLALIAWYRRIMNKGTIDQTVQKCAQSKGREEGEDKK